MEMARASAKIATRGALRATAEQRVEAVERALAILEAFDESRPALALGDLAERTGFYKSTILLAVPAFKVHLANGFFVRDGGYEYALLWGLITLAIAFRGGGELSVAPASSTAFEPSARARVLDGKCWTVPVLSGGRIYCRNADGDLVCVDVRPLHEP